jgi:hypothetical protein
VLLYLIVNTGIRFSVATFGLTFELQETAGVEHPVMISDWASPAWFPVDPEKVEEFYRTAETATQVKSINMTDLGTCRRDHRIIHLTHEPPLTYCGV